MSYLLCLVYLGQGCGEMASRPTTMLAGSPVSEIISQYSVQCSGYYSSFYTLVPFKNSKGLELCNKLLLPLVDEFQNYSQSLGQIYRRDDLRGTGYIRLSFSLGPHYRFSLPRPPAADSLPQSSSTSFLLVVERRMEAARL